MKLMFIFYLVYFCIKIHALMDPAPEMTSKSGGNYRKHFMVYPSLVSSPPGSDKKQYLVEFDQKNIEYKVLLNQDGDMAEFHFVSKTNCENGSCKIRNL